MSGFTSKIHLLVNSRGLPMKVALSPGQTSDYLGYDAVMDDELPQPKVLLAHKGYDSDAIRDDV